MLAAGAAVTAALAALGAPAAWAIEAATSSGGDAASASAAAASAAAAAAAAASAAVAEGRYVPSPVEPGWEIWVGFVAGVVPFAIGSYEFGKRILIQLRCEECGGRGLAPSSGPGRDKYLRKCPTCGGFFPWISWQMFLSSNATPGNGGPLLQPKGQRSVLYDVPAAPDPEKQAAALARTEATLQAMKAGVRAGAEGPKSGGEAGVGRPEDKPEGPQ
ncbi:hypothetical protein HYH03_006557 [Edaphochlamys debaryana]|uniref:Uncharacterized protein n=1 Tax=Edaphochlamys debaryana TaxID=47281 RepID=A0A835Y530_9CHLO|nr:hypothetical protein HYH03_006557 [Edaphochlamys debaryana]|eukprot:KAG2495284.1 hypothetical protein HYH03_006557 [Edaphochlamys debaryana]